LFRVLTCIGTQHNPWLLAVAVLVCLVAVATTLRLYVHGRGLAGPRSLLWLVCGGVSGAAGIWATHFISMLAYEPGLPTGYELAGTMGSLVIAAAGVGAGLILAARVKSRAGAAMGGAVVGLAIAAMHYAGMSAFRTEGFILWNYGYVAVAIASGVAFAALSLVVASERPTIRRSMLAAVLLVLAIVCLHFISMAAVTVVPNTRLRPPTSVLPNQAMALAVGAISGLIMIAAAVVLLLETWNQRQTLALLNRVIEAMPDGLAYFDAHDRYVLWNRKYETISAEFGFKPERGRTYTDCSIIPASVAVDGGPEARAAFIAERRAHRAQARASREEQSERGRWVRTEESRTADGGRVSVVVDISSLKQTAADLAVARDAAEAANRAKSEFLANMSHEIRTPMNGVLGVADALALGQLDERQAELVEMIRSSGRMLNHLLCDILDLARVESGAMELQPAPFELGDAVREVARLSAVHAREKGIDFSVTIAPEAERTVVGDPMRLKQILTNLTSNAVKFTEDGEVHLAVECLVGPDARFAMVVRDTGCGFSPETKSRLFGRFQQADAGMNRRAGGSGLGLAISRHLAELMGGTLEAESVEGQGSTFTLTLVLPPAEPVVAPGLPSPAAAAAAEPAMRVLVVDDNANNRRLLEVLFEHLGIATGTANDGLGAIDAWRGGAFDLIVMDMQMPVMDGLEATRAIRAAERREDRARTPILFVSANAMPEHVAAARAAGGDGHLSKPIAADRLFAALANLDTAEAA
jgi:signal transduction histidine kinase/ActR/RegA family two-component response regulator